MKIKDLSTSVAFGFHINDLEDYKNFRQQIEVCKKNDINFLIGFENQSPPSPELNESDFVDYDDKGTSKDDSYEVIS